MKDAPKYLLLGEVLRPHGVRGELRVRLLTDYPERIKSLGEVFVGVSPESQVTAYRVEQMRFNQGYGLFKLHGVDDRDAADQFRTLFIMVDIEHAVPLGDDEVYLYELIGLHVKTTDGRLLGELVDVLETGANDVYIVQGSLYGEVLIPVTDETILETDLEQRIMLVKLPAGLLPD